MFEISKQALPLVKINQNIALWYVSSLALSLGAVLPMFTFSSFYIFNETFSLLFGIIHLLKEGEFLLFLIILVFSILVPIIKMRYIYLIIRDKINELEKQTISKKLLQYSKWSMLEVFLAAILISTVKLGIMASVETHIGLYLFSMGVLGSMLLTKNINTD